MNQTRKKIIFLANDFSKKGGTNNVIINLAKEMYKKNVIKLIALESSDLAYYLPADIGLSSVSSKRRFSNRFLNTVYYFLRVRKLFKMIKHEDPHVVVSFLTRSNLLNILVKAIWRFNYRCIISVRNYLPLLYSQSILEKQFRSFVGHAFKKADLILVNSQDMVEDLRSLLRGFQGEIKVIYNPIDIDEINVLGNNEPDCPWLGENVPIVLNIGRLVNQKNQKLLLQAFKEVRKKIKCRLIIIGSGPLRSELLRIREKHLFREDIKIIESQKNPYSFLKRADLFVLSSDYEGLPNVIIEALALGCPVISTDCPAGPREILQNGSCGVLTPVGDIDTLAKAITDMLSDKKRSTDLSKAGQTRAKDFSIRRVSKEYERVLMSRSIDRRLSKHI